MSLIEDHFKLHRPPFPQIADGPTVLHHAGLRDALERLRFCIDRNGICLLSSESGCGKSAALSCLQSDLDPVRYQVVYSALSTLGPFSLLSSLTAKLGLRSRRFKGETAQELIAHLRGLSKRVVVIIDEGQLLPNASLEDLRLLTAESLQSESPFSLILAGQPILRERLAEPQHYALSQRISIRVRLSPLTDSDVALFLDKHLRACGAKRVLFDPDAVTLIFQHSRGIPRLVQKLALGGLLAAASGNKKSVDVDSIEQAVLDQEAP